MRLRISSCYVLKTGSDLLIRPNVRNFGGVCVCAHKPLFHTSIFFASKSIHYFIVYWYLYMPLHSIIWHSFSLLASNFYVMRKRTHTHACRVSENERICAFFLIDVMKTFINREGQIVNEIEMNSKWQIQNSFVRTKAITYCSNKSIITHCADYHTQYSEEEDDKGCLIAIGWLIRI